MALIPFFEITTKEDVVLTELITNFSFTDTIKGESVLSLDFKDKDIDFLENDWLKIGQELFFVFGYKNGNRSSKRVAVITEITPVFGNILNVAIEAEDKGLHLKKNAAQTIYKDKTASQIASEIAKKFGLSADIEDSEINYPIYSQGGKSDMELLKELAKKNDFTFFIRDATLYFKKNLLKTSSVRTFAYKDANDIVSRFSPRISYTNLSKAAKSVTVQGVNAETNETYSETITSDNIQDDVKAGKEEVVSFGFDGSVERNTPQTLPQTESSEQIDKEGEIITTGQANKEEAVKEATKKIKVAQLSSIEANLDFSILEPQIFAGDVITMAGVGNIYNGNYLVEEVTHSISVGSAKTSLKLKRNATNKAVTTTATKVPPTAEQNVEVGSETGVETTKAPQQVRYGNDGSVSRE